MVRFDPITAAYLNGLGHIHYILYDLICQQLFQTASSLTFAHLVRLEVEVFCRKLRLRQDKI